MNNENMESENLVVKRRKDSDEQLRSFLTVEPISTTISIEDRVNQEVFPFYELLQKFKIAAGDEAGELKGEIIGSFKEKIKRGILADQLLEERGSLKEKKELAEECSWFELMRQQIEYYEENNFPQPYDSDFEEKKIVWDRERLKGKTNHELHEERRYQKFKYYLEKPPNDSVKSLRKRLNELNVSVEMFSKGVAKAYRLISARIHDGYMKWLGRSLDEFFHQDVLTAMGILLDEMGVSKKLIRQIQNSGVKRLKN